MPVGPVPRTIPYTPVNWVDGVTPVNAENLNHMEDLLEALASAPAPSGGGVKYENAWAAPTAYKQGDVVIHNGVEYIAVNDSTGQTPPAVPGLSGAPLVIGMGTSLPASPFDGQEYILVDSLTAPTYSWRFRYVAGIADAYKWVFIGGAPLNSAYDATDYAMGASYSTILPPGITLPRAGIYDLEHTSVMRSGGAGSHFFRFLTNAGAITGAREHLQDTQSGNARWVVFCRDRLTLPTAGLVVGIQINSAPTGTTSGRQHMARPVRVA